jgi:WD40 repeat protein
MNKFGTILFIVFGLSILVTSLKPFFLANELFRSMLPLDILATGWIVGIAVEGALAMVMVKNVFHVFKAGRPGQVNNAFVQASGNLPQVLIFSLIAPTLVFIFSLNQPLASSSLTTLWSGITIAFLGGAMSAFWCRDINHWGLIGLLRPTFRQIWMQEFDKWVCCVAVGDIDDDGVNEMIVGCADHNIYCFRNGTLLWQTRLGNPPAASCAIAQIGTRKEKSFVTGSSDGNVYCLSPRGEILWQVETPNWVWCCTAGDADNDGECEVVAGGMDEKLHCYKDGGEETWFAWFDSWIGCCAVGDADNDGLNEVVAGSNDHTLRCFKNGANEIWRAYFGEWVMCVAIGDVDGDGLNEVVAGCNDGTMRCYRNGNEIWRVAILGTFVTLAIGDADGDGLNEIVAGCGDNTLRIYKHGKEVWAGGLEKYPDCVTIGDFNNDGQDEVLSGDWYTWLRAFKSSRLMEE